MDNGQTCGRVQKYRDVLTYLQGRPAVDMKVVLYKRPLQFLLINCNTILHLPEVGVPGIPHLSAHHMTPQIFVLDVFSVLHGWSWKWEICVADKIFLKYQDLILTKSSVSYIMGVGLSEYRAAIGRFACIAECASHRQKKKLKKPKLKKAEREENIAMPNSTKIKESFRGNLDRWKTKNKIHNTGQRSKSLDHQREGRSRIRKPLLSRN